MELQVLLFYQVRNVDFDNLYVFDPFVFFKLMDYLLSDCYKK